jgi:type III restriction enzyme
MLNINKVIQHIWNEIRSKNTESLTPVFDKENPIRSTADIRTWYTSKPCEWLDKSHISHIVYDSTWESNEAYAIEKHPNVQSFVKNDHLGFIIYYNYQGITRKYFPDFIIRLVKNLKNGD